MTNDERGMDGEGLKQSAVVLPCEHEDEDGTTCWMMDDKLITDGKRLGSKQDKAF